MVDLDSELSGAERLVSSGGVVYRFVGGLPEVVMIRVGSVWCLPKGLVEEGETLQLAALREVREETGLEVQPNGRIGEISYGFCRRKQFFKTVHFFLFKHVGGSTEKHDSEVDSVRWFPIKKAIEVAAYPNEKKILLLAEKMLKR